MPMRANNATSHLDPPHHRKAARERPSSIALAITALLVGVTAVCTALIAPILWTAIREFAVLPKLTYEQCGAVTEDASRLACFDRVNRQSSLHSGKNVQTRSGAP